MYGLPSSVDLGFLSGRTLGAVCVGEHSLVLDFDKSVSITVESAVGCEDDTGTVQRYDDFRQAAGMLFAFLSQDVRVAERASQTTLVLEFENGKRLEIYDDSEQFESFVIRSEGEVKIVV
jgi:hypothetical protein